MFLSSPLLCFKCVRPRSEGRSCAVTVELGIPFLGCACVCVYGWVQIVMKIRNMGNVLLYSVKDLDLSVVDLQLTRQQFGHFVHMIDGLATCMARNLKEDIEMSLKVLCCWWKPPAVVQGDYERLLLQKSSFLALLLCCPLSALYFFVMPVWTPSVSLSDMEPL